MSILHELNKLMDALGIPIETGVFKGKAPDEYVVITPMSDVFQDFADNSPQYETQEARVSLFSKGNYQKRKNQIVKALLKAEFTVTDRRYIGHEDDTAYFHYGIDCLKLYISEQEE
jgi:hypothetical protein